MRRFLFLLLLLPLLNAAATTPQDQQLIRILTENKVEPWGKRQTQQAILYCSVGRKKSSELTCSVAVESAGDGPYEVYEKLEGERARELSELLSDYGITPEGKRQIQRVNVRCRLSDKQDPSSAVCIRIQDWTY